MIMSGRNRWIAAAVAVLLLPLAAEGVAQAKGDTTKGGVTVVNLAGGPVDSTTWSSDGSSDAVISLNGSTTYTFTQRAGQAVELIITADVDESAADFCEWAVGVVGAGGEPLAAWVWGGTERGEVGEGSGIGALAAPAADTVVTIRAFVREVDFCDEVDGDNDANVIVDDTITVTSLRVSVVLLPS